MNGEGRLRLAEQDDIDLLFAWANDPITRMNSFSTDWISREQHEQWFARMMNDENDVQYIYEYQGAPIGQIHLVIDGEAAKLGFSVASEARGSGHGVQMLCLIHLQVRERYKSIRRLYGHVKPNNIASQRTFEKSGYVRNNQNKDYIIYELEVMQ